MCASSEASGRRWGLFEREAGRAYRQMPIARPNACRMPSGIGSRRMERHFYSRSAFLDTNEKPLIIYKNVGVCVLCELNDVVRFAHEMQRRLNDDTIPERTV